MSEDTHPRGRRRLRSAVRADGYETWTIAEEQYDVLRGFILRTLEDLDDGSGVPLKDLIAIAEVKLAGHPSFRAGGSRIGSGSSRWTLSAKV